VIEGENTDDETSIWPVVLTWVLLGLMVLAVVGVLLML